MTQKVRFSISYHGFEDKTVTTALEFLQKDLFITDVAKAKVSFNILKSVGDPVLFGSLARDMTFIDRVTFIDIETFFNIMEKGTDKHLHLYLVNKPLFCGITKREIYYFEAISKSFTTSSIESKIQMGVLIGKAVLMFMDRENLDNVDVFKNFKSAVLRSVLIMLSVPHPRVAIRFFCPTDECLMSVKGENKLYWAAYANKSLCSYCQKHLSIVIEQL